MTYHEEMQIFSEKHPYKTMEAGGGTFRYVLSGPAEKQPLVLLNGGMNTSEMWMRYVDALSEDYQVLIFDYPRELVSNEQLMEGMNALFQKLGLQNPVLIGASYGGMSAQLYVQKYPRQVGGLVLLSTGGLDSKSIRALKRKHFFAPALVWYMKHTNYEKMKDKLIKFGMKHARTESPQLQAYAQEMFQTLFRDYTREKDLHITGLLMDAANQKPVVSADFQSLQGRILLILPTEDFFSPQMQKDLEALMHHPETVCIKGGHLSTVLRAEEYIRVLKDFLHTMGKSAS